MDLLREQAKRVVCATFPERQIYIRSDGRVQFFTFGSQVQAILAGVSLIFLGWVAFTSVNTIFKDRTVAAKESHFRQLQASYESRLANLQHSYDALNGALVSAEDRFRTLAEGLEARQQALITMVRTKDALRASLGLTEPVIPMRATRPVQGGPDVFDGANSAPATSKQWPLPSSDLDPVITGQPQSQLDSTPAADLAPRRGLPGQPHTFLRNAKEKFGQIFQRTNTAVTHPSVVAIASLEERLSKLVPVHTTLLANAAAAAKLDTKQFERVIRDAGLNPKNLVARVPKVHGMGGPELPLSAGTDREFDEVAAVAATDLEDLKAMATVLRSVPLAAPVSGDGFEATSGFGTRRDPFTQNLAFHSGLDFAGPSGSPVTATAPGVVTFSGKRGAFGNTVEIDHGFGISTRYGHLSRISVAAGTTVARGAPIGKLGSTGRSTGPHLHYEVWVANAVRNPSRFLKAGRNVLQE